MPVDDKSIPSRPDWSIPKAGEAYTIDGYRVGGLRKSVKLGQLFGYLWQPDPNSLGIKGPTTWYLDGQPTDEGDPALQVDSYPFDL